MAPASKGCVSKTYEAKRLQASAAMIHVLNPPVLEKHPIEGHGYRQASAYAPVCDYAVEAMLPGRNFSERETYHIFRCSPIERRLGYVITTFSFSIWIFPYRRQDARKRVSQYAAVMCFALRCLLEHYSHVGEI